MKVTISSILFIAGLVLVILKLAGVIMWPWVAVLLPLLVLAGIILFSVVFFLIMAVILALADK